MRESLWLFAYDVRSNKRRTAIAKALEERGGKRVNYSVFELRGSRAVATQCDEELREHLQRTDRLIRYRICESCLKHAAGRTDEPTGVRDIS